jgi:undecaprenyl-diphosphatase
MDCAITPVSSRKEADLRSFPGRASAGANTRLRYLSPLLAVSFLVLTVLVSGRVLTDLDREAARAIQSVATPWLDQVGQLLSYAAPLELSGLWVVVVSAWLWRRGLGWRAAAPFLLFATVPIEVLAKLTIAQTTEPDQFSRVTMAYHLLTLHTGFTYPSGHATRSIIIYGATCWLLCQFWTRAWQQVALVSLFGAVILILGLSRAYIGYHWPTDVIGGHLLGGAVLVAIVDALAGHVRRQDAPSVEARATRVNNLARGPS